MSSPENAPAVIETRNLAKHFKDVKAVDGLGIKVRKGEIYGFLGPNGAGKTTTIKMIMGLMHPTGGEVFINGRKTTHDSVDIRKSIGFLPERAAFYDNLTAVQTLNFFCELKGADKSVVEPLLEEVGLKEAMNRKVGTYSKGMVQLLGIAQAMIGNPTLYILDEPMGGLDARWVRVTRDKIRSLNQNGATIIFSSHILSEVQALCDRVAIINKGRLLVEDSVENLSAHLHIKPRMEIRIPNLSGNVPDKILALQGVDKAEVIGEKLTVICDSSARSDVITTLTSIGLKIQDIKTFEPTLEEAFLTLISQSEKAG